MHPKDLVFRYCKFPHIKQIGYNLKKDILKELSLFLRANSNKDLIGKMFSKKVSYNNILFFEEMGFKINFNYNENSNSYDLILKNSIDMPPINITKQTYFHYKFVNYLKHKCVQKLFDDLGFLDENILKTDADMINKIYLSETEYIAIEFFEKNKIDPFTGILGEKLRIANTLLFDKEEKCKRYYFFWENLFLDQIYFEKFVNDIINFIKFFNETKEDIFEKKINLNIKNNEILIEDFNKLVEWKDNESSEKFYNYFKNDLENHKEGTLNLTELNLFIKKLDINFVKDENVLTYLNNLIFNIQNLYIENMTKKILMLENPIYGLLDNKEKN